MDIEDLATSVIALREQVGLLYVVSDRPEAVEAVAKTMEPLMARLATFADELMDRVLPDAEDEELAPATDDPATCGHPYAFPPLPNGQLICETCGAFHFGDGEWRIE